jgi:hypothetical protein
VWVEVVLSRRVESNVKIGVFFGVKNSQNVVIKKMGAKSIKENRQGKNENITKIHLLFMPIIVIT